MFDKKKYSNIAYLLSLALIIIFPLYIIKQSLFSEEKNTSPDYVGKETCISCHEAEYKDWLGSDHDLAMDYASDSTVKGDFNNATLERENNTHRCFKKDARFYVLTDGEDGSMQEYEVKYVFGHYPLQQYLVEFEGGRLQTLAMTWNSMDSNWYYMSDSVYQGMDVHHQNWLHWTNQAQNWNSMCADCHSTNLKKAYDPQTDTYNTTWSEIDVSCEACHGPASTHIEWANLPEYAQEEIEDMGLVIPTSGIDNKQYVDNCARCHSRRSALDDFNPHTRNIYDHIVPNLPTEPYYHIDGQIREEDYVYGSFLQSKMYLNEVQCNDCHNVHSGKLILQGNDLCLQCHKAADYDTYSHTFHKGYGEKGKALISDAGVKFEVGSGTECINCHMHGQYFMGVDYRRDHSFRIPRPDLSAKMGTPNACNQCHKEESNSWAQGHIEKWFGKSRPHQYGESLWEAQQGNEATDSVLHKMIFDELYPENIRSTAIGFLGTEEYKANEKVIAQSLQNWSPSMRVAALRRVELNSQEALYKVFPLLNDGSKAVRLEAINRLLDVDTTLIPQNYRNAFEKAVEEYETALLYNADFPTGKYNLGNFYYRRGSLELAKEYYVKAIAQDSEVREAKINLAHLYSATGEPQKAETVLKDYITDNPDDGSAYYDYGLILAENKKYQESLKNLLIASELPPHNARVDHNIAMLYEFFGDLENTEKYLEKATSREDSNADNDANLLGFYLKKKQTEKAKKLVDKMLEEHPDNAELRNLKMQLR